MTMTMEEALALPFGTLAKQPAPLLAKLKTDAAAHLRAARNAVDQIDAALVFKYDQRARVTRLALGKDSGVVHFEDAGVRISVDTPKKIEWDQARLAGIVARIVAQGEDPTEFVDIAYKVSETKYNAWPAALRESFEPARTFKPGKTSYRLDVLEVAP